MANMSYCRFNNTLSDLRDCEDHLNDTLAINCPRCVKGEPCDEEHISEEEATTRTLLLKVCKRILNYSEDSEE